METTAAIAKAAGNGYSSYYANMQSVHVKTYILCSENAHVLLSVCLVLFRFLQ
jgi:hypothetical protein